MPSEKSLSEYFNNTGREDVLSGGVKMIHIQTEFGEFKVWTKRIGNNPTIKILLLHGGPGATHEYFECFDSFFPAEGFEYYYYDQLGSYYSDQPTEPGLWEISRFVEEVEQVRKALKLDKSNFYLFGQSWGGILAAEYALKYQENLKGLIISNMMMSAPAYGKYAEEVLGPKLDPTVLAEIKDLEAKGDFDNPRYMELLLSNYYTEHFVRIPVEQWPEPINRTFKHLNEDVYVPMQGPSEFGIRGTLEDWDRTSELSKIKVPTLVIGATHDTMDPEHMRWVSTQLKQGRFLLCPNGSHCSFYDDQKIFFKGLIKFINDIDQETFSLK
ncbi:MAG: proline iminopeptidase-family hydrolase [Candidatus Hermodarchaeota archaeon]